MVQVKFSIERVGDVGEDDKVLGGGDDDELMEGSASSLPK